MEEVDEVQAETEQRAYVEIKRLWTLYGHPRIQFAKMHMQVGQELQMLGPDKWPLVQVTPPPSPPPPPPPQPPSPSVPLASKLFQDECPQDFENKCEQRAYYASAMPFQQPTEDQIQAAIKKWAYEDIKHSVSYTHLRAHET